MRTVMTCACAVLLAASCASAQQPGTPGKAAESKPAGSAAPQKGLDALLEAKIRASWAAFKNRDKKAYGEFLADDYQAVEADGEGARNKMHMLRESESSMMTEYALSFFKVTPLGPEAAFVRYEAFFRFPANSAVKFEKVYIGEVWAKRDGQWKSLHYQETRVK
jgi:hypothetical protein